MMWIRLTLLLGIFARVLSSPTSQNPSSMTPGQKASINKYTDKYFLNYIKEITVKTPSIDRSFTTHDINVHGNAGKRKKRNSRPILGIFIYVYSEGEILYYYNNI